MAVTEHLRHESDPGSTDEVELSVVIPCLNEAAAIGIVVAKARQAMQEGGISGEVVVVDNGSTDGSAALAEEAGARVIEESRRGYGSAYMAGFAAARGEYIVMGDGDDTYDFGDVGRFVDALREGADLVIGNRMGGLNPGSMPWLHRYVGNPVLTGALNLFFHTGVKDAHCGMRGFRRDVLPALDLRTTGMEFASEQVIRASKAGLTIRELDIEYHRRKGESKLSSFSDGWRHLRFLLVHSPTWLFIVPGALMLIAGVIGTLVVVADINLLGRDWQIHSLIASTMLCICGAQVSSSAPSAAPTPTTTWASGIGCWSGRGATSVSRRGSWLGAHCCSLAWRPRPQWWCSGSAPTSAASESSGWPWSG